MDQQSGHLSDAQIEQYGATVTAAQPEAGDRPDPIETHLADCPACRGRVLASQRGRWALLTDSTVNTTARADHPGPGPDCPGEDDLCNLAAGVYPADQASKLTQHAAQCDHCGPILRTFTEEFSDDLGADDQALLGKLKSSSAGWQKKLVEGMLADSSASPTKDKAAARKPFPWGWVLAPTALAACAAIAFAVWYSQRETPEKVEKLLAQAYTENRQLEMRIPYAKHAEFHQLRSGEAESLLNTPASLRKAADVIQSQLKKHPDDPQWLVLSARLDLLDRHYKPALSTLERIEDENVLGSPDFLITKAVALYETGVAEQNPQAYGQAVDLLGQALRKDPDNRIALFNQAIACEKIAAFACATADWEHLLNLENDSGWSREAEEHLKAIEEKKTPGR